MQTNQVEPRICDVSIEKAAGCWGILSRLYGVHSLKNCLKWMQESAVSLYSCLSGLLLMVCVCSYAARLTVLFQNSARPIAASSPLYFQALCGLKPVS